jgi:hypothetical protein
MMPPAGSKRPDAATIESLTAALESRMDELASSSPNPGWRPFQRLNRAEYATAVKELLTAALTEYCAAYPHEDHTIRLHRALHDRQLQERAIGILMTRHQVSEDLAREMLTQHSAGEHVRPRHRSESRHQTTPVSCRLVPVGVAVRR